MEGGGFAAARRAGKNDQAFRCRGRGDQGLLIRFRHPQLGERRDAVGDGQQSQHRGLAAVARQDRDANRYRPRRRLKLKHPILSKKAFAEHQAGHRLDPADHPIDEPPRRADTIDENAIDPEAHPR